MGSLKRFFRFKLSGAANIVLLKDPTDLLPLPKTKPWKPKDDSEIKNLPEGQLPTLEQLQKLYEKNPCFLDYEKMKAEERIGNREAEEGKAVSDQAVSAKAVDTVDVPLITRAPERPAPDYELLAAQLREFALTDPAPMPLLSNASALLKDAMGDVNWAGFYLRREKTESADGAELGLGSGVQESGTQESGAKKSGKEAPELVLGPFQGKTACIRIPWGRGVCGTAALSNSTQLVPDVHEFPGHIACDSASNSEIVVPIHDRQGNVAAVLDIDSPLKGRFTEEDREGLEAFVRVLEKYGAWNE
jgi:GAF domain-containing protein